MSLWTPKEFGDALDQMLRNRFAEGRRPQEMVLTKSGRELLRRSRRKVFYNRIPVDTGTFFYGKHPDAVRLLERPDISGRARVRVAYLRPPGLTAEQALLYEDFRRSDPKGTTPEQAADLARRLAGSCATQPS